MQKHLILATVTACLLALSACGESPGCRAATGAGIGAAGGAVVGAIGGAPLTGALVGGGVGAAAGGLTSPNQVYAGRSPICN
jgi:osmotically inducible lipoprotein OsmB